MEKLYSISDLENLTGIKAHTIRIWEKRYSIFSPIRTNTNIRKYTQDDLKKLSNIAYLNNKGIRISKLSSMDDNQLDVLVQNSLKNELTETKASKDLIDALLIFDQTKIEKILTKLDAKIGFTNAMYSTVFPFLQKIGVLWENGVITPSHEHFFSNIIKQRIQNKTGKIKQNIDGSHVLLLLPNEEMHEIGLLYSQYLCKANGFNTLYTGQITPVEDLPKINESFKPEIIITSLNMPLQKNKILKIINRTNETFRDSKKIFCGPKFYEMEKVVDSSKNITFINSFDDLERQIIQLKK